MLVIARAAAESIPLESEEGVITVTIVASGRGQVRLGLTASARVRIWRAELGGRSLAAAQWCGRVVRPSYPPRLGWDWSL